MSTFPRRNTHGVGAGDVRVGIAHRASFSKAASTTYRPSGTSAIENAPVMLGAPARCARKPRGESPRANVASKVDSTRGSRWPAPVAWIDELNVARHLASDRWPGLSARRIGARDRDRLCPRHRRPPRSHHTLTAVAQIEDRERTALAGARQVSVPSATISTPDNSWRLVTFVPCSMTGRQATVDSVIRQLNQAGSVALSERKPSNRHTRILAAERNGCAQSAGKRLIGLCGAAGVK
jgi:hypothetical protein